MSKQYGNSKKVKNTSVSQQLRSMEQMLTMLRPPGLDRLPRTRGLAPNFISTSATPGKPDSRL